MNYQLKHVYKELLTEALINKDTFLEKLVNIANERPETEGQYGDIIRLIVDKYKETKLKKLKGRAQYKQKQKKDALLLIHKSLKSIKGLDGAPIDFNGMKPFYDSIIDYLNTHADVSIDDCLLSADYYMKDFYDIADAHEKISIEKGQFDFDYIFMRTNYYQDFLKFKTNFNKVTDETIPIYEDEEIKIVWPTSPASFVRCIESENTSVSWCTQSSSTWYSYTSRHFVMILRDKNSVEDEPNYIISLKVGHMGDVRAEDTCDANNAHMTWSSLSTILTPNARRGIERKANTEIVQDNLKSILAAESSEYDDYAIMLLDQNRLDDIVDLLGSASYANTGFLANCMEKLLDFAFETNKRKSFIYVFSEYISNINYDTIGGLATQGGINNFTSRHENFIKHVAQYLFEKSLNKRSHAKYFLVLIQILNSNTIPDTLRNNKAELKKAAINALNTNLMHVFKRIISSLNRNPITNDLVIQRYNFVELFETKGFIQYVKHKKGSITKPPTKQIPYEQLEAEDVISEIVTKNKDYFLESFHIFKSDAETGLTNAETGLANAKTKLADAETGLTNAETSLADAESANLSSKDLEKHRITLEQKQKVNRKYKVSLEQKQKVNKKCQKRLKNASEQYDIAKKSIIDFEIKDIDISLLIKTIVDNKEKRLSRINIDNLLPYFIELDKATTRNIIDNFLYNIEIFKYLFSKNTKIITAGYCYFKNIALNGTMKYNSNSYEVFSYIMSKSKFISDVLLNKKTNIITYVSLLAMFQKTTDISDPIKREMIKLVNHQDFIDLMFSQSHIRYIIQFIDVYTYIINESNSDSLFENIKQKISAAIIEGFFNERRDLVNHLSNIPKIKKLFIASLEQNQLTNVHQIYVLLYIHTQLDILSEEQIHQLLKDYIDRIIKGNSTAYPKALNAINTFIMHKIDDDLKLESSLINHIDRKSFFNSNRSAFRDLIVKLVKKFNDNSVPFDKHALAEIIYSIKFMDLNNKQKNDIFKNFIVIATDSYVGYEKHRVLTIIKNCLVCGLRKTQHLKQDNEIILSYVRMLSKTSQKHMRAAFPSEEDLNEIILKKYLRLLFN